MVEARNLHKIYNNGTKELHVLKGIDLRVEKGHIVSIFGPSGAGKSTLLHLLGGLDRPTEGKVYLDGVDLYNISDEGRAKIRNERIGFVFQFYHLLPEFSALENVFLPGLISGKKKKDLVKRAEQLLENVGLKDRIKHKPNQLSGGEQQRVAIARALMNEPELLFCDEPTGNLDSETGRQICELLWLLNDQRKKTFIIVTHEEIIAKEADKIIHIYDGRII
jgi:lipoprotein-releasing system ATP-binding protein